MQYNTLGNTGLIVSRLSFGAMTFTEQGRAMLGIAKTGEADADAIVGRALDAGINFFDTADVYAGGESERMLGRALAGKRDEVVIATKVGVPAGSAPTQTGLTAKHIHSSIDRSLERLGTDHVDIYMAHRDDPITPLEETLAAFDQVVRAGKARYLAFSNWPAWKVAAAMELQRANGWAPFTHGQLYYSVLGRSIELDLIPMSRRYGLGLTVWSPLAGGFLSGKYRRDAEGGKDDRRTTFAFPRIERPLADDVVDRMRAVGDAHGASVAQVALAWLLAKDAVSSVIVGSSKMQQLDDNLGAVHLTLAPEEIAALDAMTKPKNPYPQVGSSGLSTAR